MSTDIAALYAQYQVTLSEEWKLLAGLRYDYFKANREDRRTLVPAANLARTDIGYSPRAGLIWTPANASTYYVSYSYAFLPSAEQLGLATTNAMLDPETATNYEVDAAVYYRFASGKTRLSLNVENAFNKKYWPTVDGDNNISVGAPVNARLTLTTRF